MRHYIVNKIQHTVFESENEVPREIEYLEDWRDGHQSDWVLSDDGCVIQILREGTMLKPKGKIRSVRYLGTCTGTFLVSDKVKMDTSKRINIYSRFDAKYIVGNYTTSNFNVHERANKYFPEGRRDHVAQHAVLE